MGSKKGAVELSVSMIIIIVLGVVLLILGMVLVKKIACSSIGGVDIITNQLQNELKNMFESDNDVAIKEKFNEVPRGLPYGVAFAIRNVDSISPSFTYVLSVSDIGTCSISKEEALNFISLGKQGQVNVPSGDEQIELVRFDVPKSAPLCTIRYKVSVTNNGQAYEENTFDVKVVSSSAVKRAMC